MQLYKIKLNAGGYLTTSDAVNNDTLCLYGRGEAIKKARAFNGRIEKHGKNHCITEFRTAVMDKKTIHKDIINALNGQEAFTDNINNGLTIPKEAIYYGNAFDTLLSEQADHQFSAEVLDELNQLSVLMYEYTYLHLVN